MSEFQPNEGGVLLGQIMTVPREISVGISRERLDTQEEILVLEERAVATEFVQKWYRNPELKDIDRALAPIIFPRHGVDNINNQFARRLMPAFMHPDSAEGLLILRGLEAYTTEDELAVLINDLEFKEIREGIREVLESEASNIRQAIDARLAEPRGQIAWNDRYQFNGAESSRSLGNIEATGIITRINPDAQKTVKEAYARVRDTHLPLIEVLKNEKIVSINGFEGSKISHVVHDAIDHTWGFQLVRKYGLDQKFATLFMSIGDPMNTDMFKREGEVVSSIGFGVRYGSTQENGFRPLISSADLRSIFDNYFSDGQLLDRHMEAFRILHSLAPDSREMLSLGFTYSNYVTELDEQRRKHGKIKVRDIATNHVTGELSEVSADFLSFFVELHHQILSSENKHRNTLFRFHILFEEYLQGIALGAIGPETPFTVKVQDLNRYDYSKTTIAPTKLKWMFKNYGFATTKAEHI